MVLVLLYLASLPVAAGLGWFVVGPLLTGTKPFTTPEQAARGERRLRRR